MSGLTLHIDVDDRQIQGVLNRLIETGRNPAPVMKDIAAYGENSTRDRFRDGIAPDGSRWKPNMRGNKTLIETGRLLNSIVSNSGNDFAEWGTNVIYAAIHQFGGEIRPKNKESLFFRLPDGTGRRIKKVTIPARPYLGINDQDEANILSIITANIQESIG